MTTLNFNTPGVTNSTGFVAEVAAEVAVVENTGLVYAAGLSKAPVIDPNTIVGLRYLSGDPAVLRVYGTSDLNDETGGVVVMADANPPVTKNHCKNGG